MNFATFFLSASRSGTRWLSTSLKDNYSDLALTVHEPLLRGYLPRQLLGTKNPAGSDNARFVFRHAEEIEECLETLPYIECGWPCYGAIPYFADRFDGRIRVVHLTRYPVPCASSMVTHRYYCNPPRKDWLTEKALLTPFDEGVRFVDYQSRWSSLNEFEKCLYFWAEIQALGLRLEHELRVPWLRLKSEDLFANDGLDLLLDFLEFPRRESIYTARGQTIDNYHFRTNIQFDIDVIKEHPHVLAVSETLGYDPFDKDQLRIDQRYQAKHRTAPSVGTSKSVTLNRQKRNAPCPCGSGKRYKRCHGKLD